MGTVAEDARAWLKTLGLESLEPALAKLAPDTTLEQLLTLTEEDLSELDAMDDEIDALFAALSKAKNRSRLSDTEDLGEWLKAKGLTQLEQPLRDRGVTTAVKLQAMSQEDFESLDADDDSIDALWQASGKDNSRRDSSTTEKTVLVEKGQGFDYM